jgi:hypothetical protein
LISSGRPISGPKVWLTLDENGSVTESALSLRDGSLKALLEARLVSDHSHTSSSSSHGGFNDDREPVLLDEVGSCLVRLNGSWGSRDNGDVGLDSERSCLGLVSQGVDGLGSGTDEGDSCVLDLFSKLRVLGKESVTGVDHVDVVLQSNSDDVVLGEVGGDWGHALADEVRFVRLVSVGTHSVLVRIDGNGGHSKLVGGSEDSDSNLSSVGNEDLLERTRGACLLLSQTSDADINDILASHARLSQGC